MRKNNRKSNAVKILHNRYIGDDAERKASLQEERVNAEVAKMISELRKDAGLTQKGLADLVGTTQSVISRLEDADYDGHSLTMLNRIAKALNSRLKISLSPENKDVDMIRYVFREMIKGIRKKRGLQVDQFAQQIGIDEEEVIAMERFIGYKPKPLTLYKLSKFSGIPQREIAILAGAIKDIPENIKDQASRFAAKSDSFATLTDEEKKALDEFIHFLKKEVK